MKNIAPLLLLGGAALMMMGGKKGVSKPKKTPTYVFYASGYNLFSRTALRLALGAKGLDVTMYDQNDLAETFDEAWANADGLIVAIDTANQRLAGAWAAVDDKNEDFTSEQVAGSMAKPMTMTQLGTQGVAEAVALAHGSTS